MPPFGPPLADRLPATLVLSVDSTVIWPPLPVSVASAFMVAPDAMDTLFAVCVAVTDGPPCARASVVPIATVPPPALPEAFTRAVLASATLPVAFTATEPPVVPAAKPWADNWPVTSTEPPMPLMEMVPVLPPAVLAEILPPAETRFCTTPSAAAAVNCTVPPAARITPSLVTKDVTPSGVWVTCLVTFTDTSPSPYISRVTACAPASTTLPILALMVPALRTAGATSAARPAPLMVIVPWLITWALGFPPWSNTILPAR